MPGSVVPLAMFFLRDGFLNLLLEVINLFLLLTVFACVKVFRPVVYVPRVPSKLKKRHCHRQNVTRFHFFFFNYINFFGYYHKVGR